MSLGTEYRTGGAHLPPQPPVATGVLKQPSHEAWSDTQPKQQASQTLQLVIFTPHEVVPVLLNWPQLWTGTHLQVSMQLSADCVPAGSRRHWAVVVLHEYIVGAGVGGVGGAGVGAQAPLVLTRP